MTSMLRTLVPCAALLAVTLAQAQQPPLQLPAVTTTREVCTLPLPKVPALDWRGKARFSAKARTQNGKVVAIEITSLLNGVDRRSQRALMMAITEALQAGSCEPGEHVFEKTYTFDIPSAAAAATTTEAEAAASSAR